MDTENTCSLNTFGIHRKSSGLGCGRSWQTAMVYTRYLAYECWCFEVKYRIGTVNIFPFLNPIYCIIYCRSEYHA